MIVSRTYNRGARHAKYTHPLPQPSEAEAAGRRVAKQRARASHCRIRLHDQRCMIRGLPRACQVRAQDQRQYCSYAECACSLACAHERMARITRWQSHCRYARVKQRETRQPLRKIGHLLYRSGPSTQPSGDSNESYCQFRGVNPSFSGGLQCAAYAFAARSGLLRMM